MQQNYLLAIDQDQLIAAVPFGCDLMMDVHTRAIARGEAVPLVTVLAGSPGFDPDTGLPCLVDRSGRSWPLPGAGA